MNNQKFVMIPHARFIDQLVYKFEEVGVRVVLTEESYTSKASCLDGDVLPVYRSGDGGKHVFSGSRVERGLYRAAGGVLLNADVNGAVNIVRKVVPDAIVDGVVGAVVRPGRVTIDRSGGYQVVTFGNDPCNYARLKPETNRGMLERKEGR